MYARPLVKLPLHAGDNTGISDLIISVMYIANNMPCKRKDEKRLHPTSTKLVVVVLVSSSEEK